jgi:N utilization substance protein A
MDLTLIEAFSEFKDSKNLSKQDMMDILEEVFRSMLIIAYGTDENFDIVSDSERGEVEVVHRRVIVADKDWQDELLEIPYSEAIKIQSDFEIGEEVFQDVPISSFSRRGILSFGQQLKTKLLEKQKRAIYDKYIDRVGEVIVGEVQFSNKKETIVVDQDGNDLKLLKSEQIATEFFKKGDTVKAVIKSVELKNGQPFILLSRTDNMFLTRLLEREIPEIADGLITIKAMARIPGEKAKLSVESYDDKIDPVGSCVGVNGSRIKGIVKELRGENLDIVNYSSNLSLYVSRALSPAKISKVHINEEDAFAEVWLESDQISLAIGKNGSNIKLASSITGLRIDVYREGEFADMEDVLLTEFSDEIESWMIDELKNIGCDTAKNVLALSKDELVRRTDLEEEHIDHIFEILRAEFE